MTGAERVAALLSGSPTDRRLAAPVLSLYGCRLSGISPERYFQVASSYATGQRVVADRFDPDLLFAPFALALEAEAFGAELKWSEKSHPFVHKPPLPAGRTPGPRPKIEHSRSLSFLVETTSRLVAAAGGRTPIVAALAAPTDLPALLYGIDTWLDTLLFQPEEAMRILEVTEAHFIDLSAAYFAAGASFLTVPIAFTSPEILTDQLVETLVVPSLKRAFSRLNGPVVFHHGSGPLAKQLFLFSELPKVVGFALESSDDASLARRYAGPERLLLAGPSGGSLRGRTPKAIAEDVARRLQAWAGDPLLGLITSAADVPWDTPEENLEAFMDAARGAVVSHG